MLKAIIEKEIRDILGSTKFLFTFIVCVVLILLSFYTGAMNYKANVAHWEAAKTKNIQSFEGMTEWYRVRNNRIFLPPQPLATLVSGVSNDIGRTSNIEPGSEINPTDSRYNEEPSYAYFRFMDLEFIFQIVLALFAILLGYDAVCGEKERGTLKLCLANSIPRTKFLLGKFLGSFGVLSVSLTLVISLGCVMLPLLGVHLQSEEWLRLILIIIAGLLYFGAFLAMSIMVSAQTQRTSSSFLIMLIIWIGSTMILPRAAVLISGRAVEVPTVDEIGFKKASYSTELWREMINAMGNYEVPKIENPGNPEDMEGMMAGFNRFMDSLSQVRQEKMDIFRSRLNEERHNREIERSKVAFALARISPSASLSLATSTLAGTSPELKDKFYEQSKNYQTSFNEFLTEKTGMNVGGGMMIMMSDDDGEEPIPIDISEIPAFTYERESLSKAMAQALPNMGLLLLFNCLFIAAAFISFNRYDAR